MSEGTQKRKTYHVTKKRKKKNNKIFLAQLILKNIGRPLFLFLYYTLYFVIILISFIGFIARIVSLRVLKLTRIIVLTHIPRIISNVNSKLVLKIAIFSIIVFIIISIGSFIRTVFTNLPAPSELTERKLEVSTKIYDRNGVLLYKIYGNKNRTPVVLSDISKNVILATLAAEDSKFYSHKGFSIEGMTRSFISVLKGENPGGGSTITQQLVKNALLTPERTITRKVRELVLAVETERQFSKNQILEMYLNEISYGGTSYGIQEASLMYFGKNAKDLDIAESALLAGITQSPTTLSPFTNNSDSGQVRKIEILKLMKKDNFISEKDFENALKEKIQFAQNKTDIKAPHFVMYIKQQLIQKYGEDLVENGGLNVTTTLDYNIQQEAEESVKSEIDKIKNLHVGNGASVVLNPQTGEILAMVGSLDYFDTQNDGNVNVIISERQPGSSIKVVNYAYALGHGYTPATIIPDVPTTFYVPGLTPYTPKNYDGTFRGNITLRSAFAESRNIPAVRVLASYGVDKMLDLGRKMGITSWADNSRYGLSLTLGGGEVMPLELAQAYATVANYGKKPNITSVLQIKNYKGDVIENNDCLNCLEDQIIDPRTAFMITDILKDNKARTPAFGPNSSLKINGYNEIAVKTGTSNDTKDNFTVGYTQDRLVLVWVGNNDSSPMGRIASGITGAAPIWNKIMSFLVTGKKDLAWTPPTGLQSIAVCQFTGTLPCANCPTKQEWFLDGVSPQKACSSTNTRKELTSTAITKERQIEAFP